MHAGRKEIGQQHDPAGAGGHTFLPARDDPGFAKLQVCWLDMNKLPANSQNL